MIRRTLAAACLLALGACATVNSTRPATDKTPAEGFTYFLPTRAIQVTATREMSDPASLKESLDKKTAELAAAKTAAEAASAEVKQKKAVIDNLPETASAEVRATLTGELDVARANETIANRKKDTLASTVAGLKQLYEAALAAPSNTCTYGIKVDLLPATPDATARYVAVPNHNWLRDDTAKLTAAGGLLTSGNAVSVDRTGDIIAEIAGARAGLGAREGSNTGGDVRCDAGPKTFTRIIDPLTGGSALTTELLTARYPFQVQIFGPDGEVIPKDAPLSARSGVAPAGSGGALYYRSAVPMRISVRQCTGATSSCDLTASQPVYEGLAMIPQAGPVSYIPMNAGPFVKTVSDVQFADGAISSWSTDRPSEVLEVARLPLKITDAVFASVSRVFQLRINAGTQNKSLAENQLAEITARQRLRLQTLCLNAAGEDADAIAKCITD